MKLAYRVVIASLFIWAYANCQASGVPFSHYLNARFNYEVSYPSFLAPQGEPTNGDGQSFIGKEGTLTVWGSFFPNLDSQQSDDNYNIKDEFNFEKAELHHQGYALGYSVLKADWFVITAADDNKVIYFKKIAVKPCGIHIYLKLIYPKQDKAYWDPLVTRISHSFNYHSENCQGDYRT